MIVISYSATETSNGRGMKLEIRQTFLHSRLTSQDGPAATKKITPSLDNAVSLGFPVNYIVISFRLQALDRFPQGP